MKTNWLIIITFLAFSSLSQSQKSVSKLPTAAPVALPLKEKVKAIADSTRTVFDSIAINKKALNEAVDSSAAGNEPLKVAAKGARKVGGEIDKMILIVEAEKSRVDFEADPIPVTDSITLGQLPKINADSASKTPTAKSTRYHFFKRRP